jgi:hypothetical protein
MTQEDSFKVFIRYFQYVCKQKQNRTSREKSKGEFLVQFSKKYPISFEIILLTYKKNTDVMKRKNHHCKYCLN